MARCRYIPLSQTLLTLFERLDVEESFSDDQVNNTDNRNTANPESNDGTAICKREMIVTRFINEINGDINGLGLSSCHVNLKVMSAQSLS